MTAMKGGVVQDQNDGLVGVSFQEQLFQEGDESDAVLVLGSDPGDGVVQVLMGTDGMMGHLLTRCGNPLLLASFRPTGPQGWMQTQLGFVHKEEPDIA
jgi:hypothetical protein